jgi:hypothetical protein
VAQTAVLAHPATRALITHGGLESSYEAVYHKVPLLVLPQWGDNFVNGHKARAAGVGGIIPTEQETPESIAAEVRSRCLLMLRCIAFSTFKHGCLCWRWFVQLKRLLVDEAESVRRSAERLRTLMVMASRGGVAKAADLIETELLVGRSRNMSFCIGPWGTVTQRSVIGAVALARLTAASC